MRHAPLLILASAFLFASAARAERVLVPIAINGELRGEYGSIFRSQLAISNASPESVRILGAGGSCDVSGCDPRGGVGPNATAYFDEYGTLLDVSDEDGGKLRYILRVYDLSRRYSTWGSSIPVVREQEAFSGSFGITDIPNEDGFRSMLRVYSFSESRGGEFRLRVYGVPAVTNIPSSPDVLIADTTYSFAKTPVTLAPVVELPLRTFFTGQPYGRFRVEIEPISVELRLWAVASVTNNETQHITILTP
jgi:hypothetical protein